MVFKNSIDLYKKALNLIPGGVNSPVRAFKSVNREAPIFVKKGEGARIYDEDDNEYIDYADFRDDRANFYLSLRANETKVIKLKLNASYAGRYYLPGTYAEAMYNNRYNTRTTGQWIVISR